MLLENNGALELSTEAIQINSLSAPSNSTAIGQAAGDGLAKAPQIGGTSATPPNAASNCVMPANRVAGHLPSQVAAKANGKGDVVLESSASQTDVIEQALELRNQLRTVLQGLNEVVTQIRQQRKKPRLMKSTLQSLKRL